MSGSAGTGIAQAKYAASQIYFAQASSNPATGGAAPYWLLLLFLSLIYSQLPMLVPAVEPLRPVYIVGGVAILAAVLARLLSRRGWEFVWPESPLMLAFVAAAALSCLGALWMRYSVENTLVLVKAAALYFLIINTVNSAERLRGLFWVMVLGGLFPAIGTLANYFQGDLVEGRSGWLGIFMNPNELAYSLIILIPLAVCLAAEAPLRARAVLWTTIAVYVAAIYVSFSRGGMLALLVVLGLIGLQQKGVFTRALMLLLLAGSLAFVAQGWSRSEGFTDLGTDANFQQRLVTIQAGLAMFADHPLTGVGIGNSVVAWPLYAPPGFYTRGWLVIHNTFVQALSETGILGFVCFALLLGTAIYDAWKMKRAAAPPFPGAPRMAGSLGMSLWGFVVCGLSGGFVLSWFPYILIALIAVLKAMPERPIQIPAQESR